jgi:hypothetical protein
MIGAMLFCALCCGIGQFIGGAIAGMGFIGIAIVLGGINLIWAGLAVFICIVIIGMRIFIHNPG